MVMGSCQLVKQAAAAPHQKSGFDAAETKEAGPVSAHVCVSVYIIGKKDLQAELKCLLPRSFSHQSAFAFCVPPT